MKIRQYLKNLFFGGYASVNKHGKYTYTISELTDLTMDAQQSQEVVIPDPNSKV